MSQVLFCFFSFFCALFLFSQTDSDDVGRLILGGLHIFSLAGSSLCLSVASELPVSAANKAFRPTYCQLENECQTTNQSKRGSQLPVEFNFETNRKSPSLTLQK